MEKVLTYPITFPVIAPNCTGKVKPNMCNVKYFCIGRNKTGTTSLKTAFSDLGYSVGKQKEAERIAFSDYFNGDFTSLEQYCHSAQVFQDIPFSLPRTYAFLDHAFPGSKFILTMRDAEQWYQSLTTFHAKLWGRNGSTPTAEDLKNATYITKGSPYTILKTYGTDDSDPYNKEKLIAHYEKHNRDILSYFKDRPDDLLVIDVTKDGSYQELVKFLGVEPLYDQFPWKNKTAEHAQRQ